jgi:type II secretory pathway predicted ATPase ExeA
MYRSFYHLREKPFTLLPDPGFLYLSSKHRMALTLLEYGLMNQAGFTVISGDIGTGKTTLIRHLLDHMDREHTVGLITNTHRSFGELLQWILLAYNLEHANLGKAEMYRRFVDFIIDEYAHNRRVVLIVDEAQNMAVDTLEELRMLSNINADKDQALQVILVGQRELRDTLRRPDLVQFAQRISVDYHLEPLSEEETQGYIRHRVEIAGGDPQLFDEAACRAVHRYTNGVPRLINLLCDTVLVYGYAEQQERIATALVTDVARDKQRGGIFPTFHPAEAEAPADTPSSPATEATGAGEGPQDASAQKQSQPATEATGTDTTTAPLREPPAPDVKASASVPPETAAAPPLEETVSTSEARTLETDRNLEASKTTPEAHEPSGPASHPEPETIKKKESAW